MYVIKLLVVTSNNTILDQSIICTVDCTEEQAQGQIPFMVNRLVKIHNLAHKRIGANKQTIAHIIPVKGIDFDKAVKRIDDYTNAELYKYNEAVDAHNVVVKRANRLYHNEMNENVVPNITAAGLTIQSGHVSDNIIVDDDGTIIVR